MVVVELARGVCLDQIGVGHTAAAVGVGIGQPTLASADVSDLASQGSMVWDSR